MMTTSGITKPLELRIPCVDCTTSLLTGGCTRRQETSRITSLLSFNSCGIRWSFLAQHAADGDEHYHINYEQFMNACLAMIWCWCQGISSFTLPSPWPPFVSHSSAHQPSFSTLMPIFSILWISNPLFRYHVFVTFDQNSYLIASCNRKLMLCVRTKLYESLTEIKRVHPFLPQEGLATMTPFL